MDSADFLALKNRKVAGMPTPNGKKITFSDEVCCRCGSVDIISSNLRLTLLTRCCRVTKSHSIYVAGSENLLSFNSQSHRSIGCTGGNHRHCHKNSCQRAMSFINVTFYCQHWTPSTTVHYTRSLLNCRPRGTSLDVQLGGTLSIRRYQPGKSATHN